MWPITDETWTQLTVQMQAFRLCSHLLNLSLYCLCLYFASGFCPTRKPCSVTHICCMSCLSCSFVVTECKLRSSMLCATCMNTCAVTLLLLDQHEYYRRKSPPKSRFRLCVSANWRGQLRTDDRTCQFIAEVGGIQAALVWAKSHSDFAKWRRSRASVCCVATWVVSLWPELPDEYSEVYRTSECYSIDRV